MILAGHGKYWKEEECAWVLNNLVIHPIHLPTTLHPHVFGQLCMLGLKVHPLYLQPSGLMASSWILPIGGTARKAETGRQKMSTL